MVGLVAAGVVLAACSSSASISAPNSASGSTTPLSSAATTPATTNPNTEPSVAGEPTSAATAPSTDAPTTTAARPACDAPTTTTPLAASKVAGSASDVDVTSFDGTVIRAHWFPVAGASTAAPAPTVLMGPGWGSSGDTNTEKAGLLGSVSIASIWAHGYNVLTWDPRGFGQSTGSVEIDSPEFEGRDVQQLLDWIAAQPEAQLDTVRDPRVAMVGSSYGGGIQLVTAAIDCRVDAIVPIIAWHSLDTSLYKNGIVKLGWDILLATVSAGRPLDPHIDSALASAQATGTISADDQAWFATRGAPDLIDKIKIPTLIIQGTVDALFPLGEGLANYQILRKDGVEAAMLWFCGGHGTCLSSKGDDGRVVKAAMLWLDRYLKGDDSVETGPRFEMVDQDGQTYSGDDYPEPDTMVSAEGTGTLKLVADGGSGPATAPTTGDVVAGAALAVTPARAVNAANLTVDFADEAVLVGAPKVTLAYTGTVAAGDRPTEVFAQLVDETTGLVLGNQVTPIPVTLDGAAHEVTMPIEIIAHHVTPGSKITLQIVATTVAYAQPRLDGQIDFTRIAIELPVVAGLRTATSRL